MDKREYINEIFKIVSINSVLVIDRYGRLRRIYCPFRAIVVIPIGTLQNRMVVLVEAIKMTEDLRDVFIVEGKAYYLVHFKIMLDER